MTDTLTEAVARLRFALAALRPRTLHAGRGLGQLAAIFPILFASASPAAAQSNSVSTGDIDIATKGFCSPATSAVAGNVTNICIVITPDQFSQRLQRTSEDLRRGSVSKSAETQELEAAVFAELAEGPERFYVKLKLWPYGIVPFSINNEIDDKELVRKAISNFDSKTTIRLVERSGANAQDYPNYVSFIKGRGCSSFVGMQGGEQQIRLSRECGFGSILHQIAHTVGLHHENTRPDRDRYVQINWNNIEPHAYQNFYIRPYIQTSIRPYDYDSVMHFPADAFSHNGEPTIVPLQEGKSIGQREALSAGDVTLIDYLYREGGAAYEGR